MKNIEVDSTKTTKQYVKQVYEQPTSILVGNYKGGVGKTTFAFNLAAGFNHFAKKVLLIGFDPQNNVAQYLTNQTSRSLSFLFYNIYEYFNRDLEIENINENFGRYEKKNTVIDIISYGDEKEVIFYYEKVLKLVGKKLNILNFLYSLFSNIYDIIIIDTPPNPEFYFNHDLIKSSNIVLPITDSSSNSLEGLRKFVENYLLYKESGLEYVKPHLCATVLNDKTGILTTTQYCKSKTKILKETHKKIKQILVGTEAEKLIEIPYSTKYRLNEELAISIYDRESGKKDDRSEISDLINFLKRGGYLNERHY